MVDAILPIFTAQKAEDLHVATDRCERQLIEIFKHLRSTFGRGFIPPGILQVLRAHKDLFLDLFSSSTVKMQSHLGLLVPKDRYLLFGYSDFIDSTVGEPEDQPRQ